jgi:hypothetical protein
VKIGMGNIGVHKFVSAPISSPVEALIEQTIDVGGRCKCRRQDVLSL